MTDTTEHELEKESMALWRTTGKPEKFKACYITYLEEGNTKVARVYANNDVYSTSLTGGKDVHFPSCWRACVGHLEIEVGNEIAWMYCEELPKPYKEA